MASNIVAYDALICLKSSREDKKIFAVVSE